MWISRCFAAMVLLGGGIACKQVPTNSLTEYYNPRDFIKTFDLPNGNQVLMAHSSLCSFEGPYGKYLRLDYGQFYFRVKQSTEDTLTLRHGNVCILAVGGAEFNIDLTCRGYEYRRITVYQGIVRLVGNGAPMEVQANETVAIRDHSISPVPYDDWVLDSSWMHGEYRFKTITLEHLRKLLYASNDVMLCLKYPAIDSFTLHDVRIDTSTRLKEVGGEIMRQHHNLYATALNEDSYMVNFCDSIKYWR